MKLKTGMVCAIAILLLSAMPLAVMADSQSGSAQAANITVFTDSAAYAPGQLVQMYANVTYSGTALVNQNVAFSVENSSGSVIAVRAAETNDSGVADADFRMPLIVQNSSEAAFGTWSIVGTVNVTQNTLTDTTEFTFGYLGGISNIQVPTSIHQLDYLNISITIDNLVGSESWSEIDITLLDQSQTPIGSAAATNTMNTQAETINASIYIPKGAFIGQATVYICLLTASGVAATPEGVANFQILPADGTSSPSVIAGSVLAFVVPEYAYGGLIALGAALAGFIAFERLKKKNQHSNTYYYKRN